MEFFDKIKEKVVDEVSELIEGRDDKGKHEGGGEGKHEKVESHGDQGAQVQAHSNNRFASFAPQSSGHPKWYVDGASYFYAVSLALEQARETIYILDWWLTPELYLRRPPAKNEQYRLDNMLRAAAERGVQIYVIVYKEVPQALTLDSQHTKHALEDLHPNIRVFRHPDHHPTGYDIKGDLETGFKNLSMRTFDLAKVSQDALKTLYGTADDVVLYWAHHEKLCVIDGRIAFMGGLDLCFGRWDTNSHPIADAHPGNIDSIIFPGQDYNNARVYDFEDVQKWENNKLDRTKSSRMGWSDISISLTGPIVNSLILHFVDRWNYILGSKYHAKDGEKYSTLQPGVSHTSPPREGFVGGLHHQFQHGMQRMMHWEEGSGAGQSRGGGGGAGAQIQLTRSACPWSSGHPTEHSIRNAYIDAITNAKHFVYIENQFFITATSDEQHPVSNKIGRAIVDRIVRAHQANEPFHIIIVIPAVPAFAGDLKSDGALGTRAIMEFQYFSINRGGHSIIESLREAGVDDPGRYIRFYNLRNYDRLNTSATMTEAEGDSGVRYESARREFDNRIERGVDGYEPYEGEQQYQGSDDNDPYRRYQAAAGRAEDDARDSVAACYMEGGPDVRQLPWTGPPDSELGAYVSEELYVHSKVLIADDRLVICGSANLNDRSQLGDHDSEIAVVIEDPTPVESAMAGRPHTASAFASSLRRQLFRKHLGLLPHQPVDQPNPNWTPVDREPNRYDWDSRADQLVRDPLDPRFLDLWRGTARRNTETFSRAFHPVPNDAVRTWDDYESFFSRHFIVPGSDEDEKKKKEEEKEKKKKDKDDKSDGGKSDNESTKSKSKGQDGRVDYGHVVPEEFPGGVRELKDWLARIRGTLVEMPLEFLIDVKDMAKEGLTLNSLTDEIYT